jgi:hypothetical protein
LMVKVVAEPPFGVTVTEVADTALATPARRSGGAGMMWMERAIVGVADAASTTTTSPFTRVDAGTDARPWKNVVDALMVKICAGWPFGVTVTEVADTALATPKVAELSELSPPWSCERPACDEADATLTAPRARARLIVRASDARPIVAIVDFFMGHLFAVGSGTLAPISFAGPLPGRTLRTVATPRERGLSRGDSTL